MGPVVALIGLELAGTAASNAGLQDEVINPKNVIVFLATLLTAVIGSVVFRKFLSVIPILVAIIVGYVAALLCGIVDFTEVGAATWLAIPNFAAPKFKWEAIVIILPVLLVIASEHIGHQIVTSKVVGRDLLKDPGLHRSLFADNFSTMISGFIGSVPTTTYGENIGVMAITKGIQCLCHRRSGSALHRVFLHWENDHTHQYHSGSGNRRDFLPAVWNDRRIRYPYSGRGTGGLRQIQKHGNDIRNFRNRTFRYIRSVWKHPAVRNGSCLRRGDADGADVLYPGQAETDKRQRGSIERV